MLITWVSCHSPPFTHIAWLCWPLNIPSPLLPSGLSTNYSVCLELLSLISPWVVPLYHFFFFSIVTSQRSLLTTQLNFYLHGLLLYSSSHCLCYVKFSSQLFTCLFSVPPTAPSIYLYQDVKLQRAGPLFILLTAAFPKPKILCNTQQALDK